MRVALQALLDGFDLVLKAIGVDAAQTLGGPPHAASPRVTLVGVSGMGAAKNGESQVHPKSF